MLEEAARMQEPTLGCIVLYQELASSAVDPESIRKDFMDARAQADLGRPSHGSADGWHAGPWMRRGMQPIALASAFHTVGGGRGMQQHPGPFFPPQ